MSAHVDRMFAPTDVRSSTPTLIERTVTTVTAMELPSGSFRWVDADGAELLDVTDAPKVGVQVSLRDEFDHEVAQTTTDHHGSYHFDDLPIGDYTVVFTVPSGSTASSITAESEQARLRAAMAPREWLSPPPIQTWANGLRASRHLRLTGTLG